MIPINRARGGKRPGSLRSSKAKPLDISYLSSIRGRDILQWVGPKSPKSSSRFLASSQGIPALLSKSNHRFPKRTSQAPPDKLFTRAFPPFRSCRLGRSQKHRGLCRRIPMPLLYQAMILIVLLRTCRMPTGLLEAQCCNKELVETREVEDSVGSE